MATKPAYLDDHAPTKDWGVYYDPVYKYIRLPPVFREALDIPLVQRLRRIKQLSTAELVFPGATHNRLQHSVGVYHLATLASSVLREQQVAKGPSGWPDLGQKGMMMGLQLAALFHDVGHGPFSHIFEIFCRRAGLMGDFGHRALARRLILGEIKGRTEIADFLRYAHSSHADVPGAEYLEPKNVAAMATGQAPPDHPECLFLSQIVDSTFDVDRMDYLLRDSLHLGIDLGADPWAVLHAYTLAPWVPEDASPTARRTADAYEPPWGLAINLNAAVAAEGMLAARDQAYRRVYCQSTHRIDQEMLVLAMWEYTNGQTPWELWHFTDEGLLEAFDQRKDTLFEEIARRIRERRLYEALPYEISVATDLDERARHEWRLFNSQAGSDSYGNVAGHARSLAKAAGFDDKRDRIILDMEQIPLSKLEDYKRTWLWDPVDNTRRSLVEVCPHLELTHRVEDVAGKRRSIHQEYVEAASRLIVSFPFRALRAAVRAEVEGLPDTVHDSDKEQICRSVCHRNLDPVLDGLLQEVLRFSDEEAMRALKTKMSNAAMQLLYSLVEEEFSNRTFP